MDPIFHLALQSEWSGDAAPYAPAAFATERFIHCSSETQVEATANRYFRGRRDLVLLVIDPLGVEAPVRWEPPIDPQTGARDTASGVRFPHVYGRIPRSAVVATHALTPDADGRFVLAPFLPPRSPHRTAVIFDCDGVLFESRRANVAYYDAIRAALGLAAMDAAWQHRVHFLASSQVFHEMFGPTTAAIDRARAAANAIDYTPFFSFMDPADELHAVLAALKPSHRLAMATNRGSTVLEVVRRFGLSPYFDTALGVHDVARPKPHPDLLLAACGRLGVEPADALYVGDAETDWMAARDAGLQFVAVGDAPWSAAAITALRELPAHVARVFPFSAR